VAVFAQALFALVGGNLMAFTFLTAGHCRGELRGRYEVVLRTGYWFGGVKVTLRRPVTHAQGLVPEFSQFLVYRRGQGRVVAEALGFLEGGTGSGAPVGAGQRYPKVKLTFHVLGVDLH